jgi:UDP-3-O-[3-hydroxymyristoyl] glucosamine N-acyltransferase
MCSYPCFGLSKTGFTPPSQLFKLIIFFKTENCVAADAEIGNQNRVAANQEIGSKNRIAADAEIGSENCVAADQEIASEN